MEYTKTREVKNPMRANAGDAGIDFFVPEYSDKFFADLIEKNTSNKVCITKHDIIVGPHGKILIPAGVKVIVPEGNALIAFNKSGIASKFGLDIGACVIDEGYRGEMHINLLNTSDEEVKINYGQKITQFLLMPVNNNMPIEITNERYSEHENTDRGEGGFGSSGI